VLFLALRARNQCNLCFKNSEGNNTKSLPNDTHSNHSSKRKKNRGYQIDRNKTIIIGPKKKKKKNLIFPGRKENQLYRPENLSSTWGKKSDCVRDGGRCRITTLVLSSRSFIDLGAKFLSFSCSPSVAFTFSTKFTLGRSLGILRIVFRYTFETGRWCPPGLGFVFVYIYIYIKSR
jgi:hypothetical protein